MSSYDESIKQLLLSMDQVANASDFDIGVCVGGGTERDAVAALVLVSTD